jgi:glycine/D-amino acid oxidase-like deaminating enzyme
MRVAVVGAGILGASVAYHLAGSGVIVEIIEERRPGAGTSGATFAYLNALRHSPPYSVLRLDAIRYWDNLAGKLGVPGLVHKDGSLFCSSNAGDMRELEHLAEEATGIGLAIEWLSRDDLRRHEPDLELGDTVEPILRVMEEGRLEVVPMIGHLVAAALMTGAVYLPVAVDAIEAVADGVELVIAGAVQKYDRVVVCAGVGTRKLLESLGVSVPIVSRPGVTIVTRPLPYRLQHVVYARGLHFQPDGGGRVLAGRTDYRDQLPDEAVTAAAAAETFALLRSMFHHFNDSHPECVRVGVRAIPGDGLPIAGTVPGAEAIYVLTSHSGISLGGLLGALVAHEVATGEALERLSPYRPARFQQKPLAERDFAPWAPGDRDWEQAADA